MSNTPDYTSEASLRSARNFTGVIDALIKVAKDNGLPAKSYPRNWNGIIAAILALGNLGGVGVGPSPPGWEIIIDPDTGDPIGLPAPDTANGTLWFDERQGKLLIYINGEWYQTNGADGIPIVSDDPPDNVVPGALWYNPSTTIMYLYLSEDAGWVPVSATNLTGLTSATLPLANSTKRTLIDTNTRLLPPIENPVHQSDANIWFVNSLTYLDDEVEKLKLPKPVIIMGDTPPDLADRYDGLLWYDTEALDLLVWYDDGDTQQWVPTSSTYIVDEKVEIVTAKIEDEQRNRERAISSLNLALTTELGSQLARIATLENQNISTNNRIDLINSPDFSPYATIVSLQNTANALEELVDNVRQEIPNLDHLAPYSYIDNEIAAVNEKFDNYAKPADVTAVRNLIPDVSNFATTEYVQTSIDGITVDYLNRNGGQVRGSFTLNNPYVGKATLDFSNTPMTSKLAMQFKSNGPGTPITTFGSTNNYWEYAWEFNSHEDYCWKHNGNKVLSIAEDGVACTKLVIGQFQPNNAEGRIVMNRIDVGAELLALKAEITQLKSAIQ